MNKVFLLVISLLIIFIASNFIFGITGFVINTTYVSIAEKLQGKITALNYKNDINITEFQNITAEFTNIGTVQLTGKIEITVYFYNTTTLRLDPVAYYYDSSVQLLPGMRRIFKTVFTPPDYGTYYIKVRVPYETRVTEMWGVFTVTYKYGPTPPEVIYIPPASSGPIEYIIKELGTPRLTAEYQNSYDLYPGQSLLISVNAKNIGETSLNDLRMTISTSNLIIVDVNPKVLSSLGINKSNIFLISLTIPKDIPLGTYPLNFEILSDKIMEFGSISLNITSKEVSIKDEVYQTILNYEYLIDELEKKVSDAKDEGLNVTNAERSLERAKEGLELARDYYDQGVYDRAKEKLDEIKKDFEDTVFQLAQARLRVTVAPAFSPFIIIILAIIMAIIFLFILRRRKEKRPKLLREVSEET